MTAPTAGDRAADDRPYGGGQGGALDAPQYNDNRDLLN